jgi:hypothetical protein
MHLMFAWYIGKCLHGTLENDDLGNNFLKGMVHWKTMILEYISSNSYAFNVLTKTLTKMKF